MKVIQLFKNDAQLIKRAALGNRKAQQRIYELHSPKMLSVCRQYIKDLNDAEEVMLNGFLKVFTHLKNFENKGSFEGWVRKIMVREAISFLRAKKQITFTNEETFEVEKLPEDKNTEFGAAHIQNIIDALPQGYKIVFVMYAVEGYKHAEIAKMLNISEGTSKSQLYKARKMLQQQLKNEKFSGYGI